MLQTITVKNKLGQAQTLTLKSLDLTYLNEIMGLQDTIIEGLKDQAWFAHTSIEEFKSYFLERGTIIGCLTPHDELIAVGVYVKNDYHEDNYGYDLEFQGDDLLKIGQIEITIVREDFRGYGLQKLLCQTLEEIGHSKGTPLICATICPDNIYSVNTLLNLGYTIEKEKLKYGGLRRYILMKNLNSQKV